jgi:hypothetical protein
MALGWLDRVASDASPPSLQLVFQSLRAPIVDAPAVGHLSHCLPLTTMRRRSAVKVSGPAVAAALMIQHAFELAHDRVSCRNMIENYAANGGMLRAEVSCIAPHIALSHLSRILFLVHTLFVREFVSCLLRTSSCRVGPTVECEYAPTSHTDGKRCNARRALLTMSCT